MLWLYSLSVKSKKRKLWKKEYFQLKIRKEIIRKILLCNIKEHNITQCCNRRKKKPSVFPLRGTPNSSCPLVEDFMFWKVGLPVSIFAHLHSIFPSGQGDVYKCKSNYAKDLLKTPQWLLTASRMKCKHLRLTRLSWSVSCPPRDLISYSLPLLTELQPHWPPLLSAGNLIPPPGVVLYGRFHLQPFHDLILVWESLSAQESTSGEKLSLHRQIKHRHAPHHSLAHEVPVFSCSFSVYSTESLSSAPLSSQGLTYINAQ